MSSNDESPATKAGAENEEKSARRGFLSKLFMGIGLALGYGLLGGEGILFILPRKTKIATVKIYAGRLKQFIVGSVQSFYGPDGTEIMIKRDELALTAFSAVCPHLGCQVHWLPEKEEFFCPCHGGVFTSDGIATEGPPADAGQRLKEIPLEVDEENQIVYIQVRAPKRRPG